MAARATRSASRKARLTEAVATGPLGALSHDELGVIFDGLADPLQPVVAVALSSTCLGLRTPLQAALEVLKERHARAVALCCKLGMSCAEVRDAEELIWSDEGLTADDAATLGMLLHKWLPKLLELCLSRSGFSDAGVQALCADLGPGAAPSLFLLSLGFNKFGPAGAEALAAALRWGALPRLEMLWLSYNPIGSQGVIALAMPLRKRPLLKEMRLVGCGIGDEGVASLVDNLGKDDFKALEKLWLYTNEITDTGVAKLSAVLDAGGIPRVTKLALGGTGASYAAILSVQAALKKRAQ